MPVTYTVVRILTNEEARYKGKLLHIAIINWINDLKILARCSAIKGFAGCYENGEVATSGLEVLSFNMPVEITIVFPEAENEKVLSVLDEMVEDGLMFVENKELRWHKCRKHLIPRRMRVCDVMTPGPKVVAETASAGEILKLLWQAGFHSVPVVNKDNCPVGIVTQGDLVRRAKVPLKLGLMEEFSAHHMKPLEDALSKLSASDIMTAPVISIAADSFLTEAAGLMLQHKFKRLPVTDKDGKITGIVSRLDVFKTILAKNPDWQNLGKTSLVVTNEKTVAQAMRKDTPVLSPEDTIEQALQLLESTDIKRVAVVDKQGKLLGLISDRALMAAFFGHKPGLWDYLSIHLPFLSQARKDKELAAAVNAKTARDIMNTDLVLVSEGASLDNAIKLMVDKKLKRIPVVNADGIFKGMLTRDSILRAELHPHGK